MTYPVPARLSGAISTIALGIGLCFGARQALAQTAAPAQSATPAASDTSEDQSEDIVVTAQFRQQRLQDTPVAITAIDSAGLEARSAATIADVAARSPNVVLRETPATYGPAVVAYIRGVGQRDTTLSLEPGVGIYIDDVYLPTLHGSLLDLIDLDRVEILRGPQGTLTGQNSIGGAIKLYSKKPGPNPDGFVEATYGSYNRVNLRGATNFTLVPDQLWARISGSGVHSDGFVTRYDYRCTHPAATTIPSSGVSNKDCVLGTEGGKDTVAGRVALRWEPSHSASFDLIADVVRDNSEISPTTLLYVGTTTATGSSSTAPYVLGGVKLGNATGSPFISYSPFGNYAQDSFSNSPYINYETYCDPAPRNGSGAWCAPLKSKMDTWGISGTGTFQLADNISLTSITAYREFQSVYSSGEGTPIATTLQANHVYHHQFSEEIRVGAKLGIANITVGGYYFDGRSENVSRVTLPTLEFIEDNVVPSKTKAVFATADLALTSRLNVIGGIRYTDISKTFIYGRKGIPGDVNNGAPPAAVAALDGLSATAASKRVDYRAVVQYRWSPALMTYAQYSTGFKAGGVNSRPFFPAQALPHQPETLTAYEVGFKSDFLDRHARLNVSAFWNKYSDILVTIANCPGLGVPAAPCALPINAGKADVRGAEAEATLRPIEGMLIDASIAYLDFNYKSLSAAAATSGITLAMDGPYIERWQWSVGAQYAIQAGSDISITPRFDLNHEDGFNRNPVNSPFGYVGGRTLLNARLTLKKGAWQLALQARNLTNKVYYTDIFDNRGSTQSVQGRPGEPRTWAVSVKRSF